MTGVTAGAAGQDKKVIYMRSNKSMSVGPKEVLSEWNVPVILRLPRAALFTHS